MIGGEYQARNHRVNCAVVRLLPDGTRDPQFGDHGVALLEVPDHDCWLTDVKLQNDGKIVGVGGLDDDVATRTALVRFNLDGTIDTTFAADGLAIGPNSITGQATALAIDASGRFVVASLTSPDPATQDTTYFATIRFLPTGELDNSFGAGGLAEAAFNNGWDEANDLAVQPDGRIIVAGIADGPNVVKVKFGIVRYLDSGMRDQSFGGDGLVTVEFPDGNGTAEGVFVDPDGRILVGGGVGGAGVRAGLARLTSDGQLDSSFGSNGITVTPAPVHKQIAYSKIDEKYVAAGWFHVVGAAVARFNVDGSVDTTFGSSGVKTAATASQSTQANDLAIQSDGRIVVVGGRLDEQPDAVFEDFFAMRFCP